VERRARRVVDRWPDLLRSKAHARATFNVVACTREGKLDIRPAGSSLPPRNRCRAAVTGRSASPPSSADPRGELPHSEFEEIYSKVPRLTVEVVVQSPLGILLTKRASGPCSGLWHIPGGTVRFGEPIRAAVSRSQPWRSDWSSMRGRSSLHRVPEPLPPWNGLARRTRIPLPNRGEQFINAGVEHGWFTEPPEPMHAEQVAFLAEHGLLISKR